MISSALIVIGVLSKPPSLFFSPPLHLDLKSNSYMLATVPDSQSEPEDFGDYGRPESEPPAEVKQSENIQTAPSSQIRHEASTGEEEAVMITRDAARRTRVAAFHATSIYEGFAVKMKIVLHNACNVLSLTSVCVGLLVGAVIRLIMIFIVMILT